MKKASASLRDDLRNLRHPKRLEFFERVDLKAWSPYRLGGPAEVVVRCLDAEAVCDVMRQIHAHESAWLILGGSGGLVLTDRAVEVPILKLAGPLATWQSTRDGFFVGAGASLPQASRAADRAGLSGFERLFGVPGTVGGAIVSALRLHGWQALDGVDRVAAVVPTGSMVILTLEDAAPQLSAGRLVALGFWLSRAPKGDRLGAEAAVPTDRGSVVRRLFGDPDGDVDSTLRRIGLVDSVVGGARQHPDRPNDVALTSMATSDDLIALTEGLADRVLRATGRRFRHRLSLVDRVGNVRFQSLFE